MPDGGVTADGGEKGAVFQHAWLHASRIRGHCTVAGLFNSSQLLLDLGEKGVYSSILIAVLCYARVGNVSVTGTECG